MSCGAPVITSNTSSLSEVVEDSAIKVNPLDVDGLANAILKIISEPQLSQELIGKGFENIKRFNWKETAKGLLDIYQKVNTCVLAQEKPSLCLPIEKGESSLNVSPLLKKADASPKLIKMRTLLIPPKLSVNMSSKKVCRFIENRLNRNSVVLNIGSGSGFRTKKLKDWNKNFPADLLINMDIQHKSDKISLICNAEQLPFKNNCIDVAILQAVLEHVRQTQTAVLEAFRVLKEGGVIYVETPFLQPYHASPNDFWRFTREGLLELLSQFSCIESDPCAGPFSALIVQTHHLIRHFIPNNKLSVLIGMIAGYLLYPLKYLDYMIPKSIYKRLSVISGCFFIGIKRTSLNDRL